MSASLPVSGWASSISLRAHRDVANKLLFNRYRSDTPKRFTRFGRYDRYSMISVFGNRIAAARPITVAPAEDISVVGKDWKGVDALRSGCFLAYFASRKPRLFIHSAQR
jgi:hypothetical protein